MPWVIFITNYRHTTRGADFFLIFCDRYMMNNEHVHHLETSASMRAVGKRLVHYANAIC